MQRQAISKHFIEVVHVPSAQASITQPMEKWGGKVDTSFPLDEAATAAGWATTVAAFFDKRKSTNFAKGMRELPGVGSIKRTFTTIDYAPMEVESVTPGRKGSLSLLQRGKKRPVTFVEEFRKGEQVFGTVGRQNPRPFWFDEGRVQPAQPAQQQQDAHF